MRLRTWVPGVLVVLAGVVAVVSALRFERRMERAEETLRSLIQMQERPYYLINGHVYYQQPGEGRSAWVARVKAVVAGGAMDAHYVCTELERCDVPGGTVEVCTPCQAQPPSQQCIANHQADVEAACIAFSCDC